MRECMSKGIPLVFDEFPESLRWASSSTTVDDDPFMDPLLWSDDEAIVHWFGVTLPSLSSDDRPGVCSAVASGVASSVWL